MKYIKDQSYIDSLDDNNRLSGSIGCYLIIRDCDIEIGKYYMQAVVTVATYKKKISDLLPPHMDIDSFKTSLRNMIQDEFWQNAGIELCNTYMQRLWNEYLGLDDIKAKLNETHIIWEKSRKRD